MRPCLVRTIIFLVIRPINLCPDSISGLFVVIVLMCLGLRCPHFYGATCTVIEGNLRCPQSFL